MITWSGKTCSGRLLKTPFVDGFLASRLGKWLQLRALASGCQPFQHPPKT
jgi:hypothetical protein